jgi:hypothetical protein
MKLFDPYLVIEQSDKTLHLEEKRSGRRLNFFLLRIFPFVLVVLLAPVAITAGDMPMGLKYLLFTSVMVVVIMLLATKYVTVLKMTNNFIELRLHSLGKAEQKQIPIADCERIELQIFHGPRSGGLYYRVKLKEGKSVKLFTIPNWYKKMEKVAPINNVLTKITGLEVTET